MSHRIWSGSISSYREALVSQAKEADVYFRFVFFMFLYRICTTVTTQPFLPKNEATPGTARWQWNLQQQECPRFQDRQHLNDTCTMMTTLIMMLVHANWRSLVFSFHFVCLQHTISYIFKWLTYTPKSIVPYTWFVFVEEPAKACILLETIISWFRNSKSWSIYVLLVSLHFLIV